MSGEVVPTETPVVKEKRHKSPKPVNPVKHTAEDYPMEQEPTPTGATKKHKNNKHEFTKKSMSSSAMVESKLPQLIQESPSMSILASKLDDVSLTSPSNPDTSLLSEMSSGGTTTTTITITSTTDDATIITKDFEDEEAPPAPDIIPEFKDEKSDGSSNGGKAIANGNCRTSDQHHEVIVEEQDVYQIVESIRKSTNLSHELSQIALQVVISEMEALLPECGKFLEPIAVHLTTALQVPDNLLGDTHDAQRLRNLFAELADAKNDSEQRSWMLYEDEADITNYLTELIRILVDADTKICRYEMSCDAYNSVNNLVLYYQMESRWNIRKLLLRVFKAMCLLDVTCVDILISSVLPLELVQDMMANPENLEKLSELSVMLIMIFSAGHKMPTANFDHMKTDFVLFMLNLIENPLEDDQTEFLSDVMINLMLAFNLQFVNFSENTILEAMQQVKASKSFTEKILLLINREGKRFSLCRAAIFITFCCSITEDPVFVLKHTKPPINSVLKMLVDLFSVPETTMLFYTNDTKVLIDILVRQLSDLSAGDEVSCDSKDSRNS